MGITINSRDFVEAGLSAVWTPVRQRGTAVLMYHCFHPDAPAKWTVTTPVLEKQLQWLKRRNYSVKTLKSVLAGLEQGSAERHAVAITVDDGDRSVYTEMFPLIRDYRIPVTLFVYPSAISVAPEALSWAQLETMLASGLVDVQSHSLTHPSFREERARRRLTDFMAFAAHELRESRAMLADRLGVTADVLAWPHGVHNRLLENMAEDAGYTAAFSVKGDAKKPSNRFAIPRVNVAERHRGNRFDLHLSLSPQLRADAGGWRAE